MEQDQLNINVVRKVAIVFEKLNSLAIKMRDKINSGRFESWMRKNLQTVEDNKAKYVTNVKNIVCSNSTTDIKFFSKSVKQCYLLKYRDESSPDESLFKELDFLRQNFEKLYGEIDGFVLNYKRNVLEERKSISSDTSTLTKEES